MKEKKIKKRKGFVEKISLTKTNYLVFLIGVLVITAGYFLMATGGTQSTQSLTISPIFLLIGYLIIVPISIFIGGDESDKSSD
jgi:amino acid transporter